MTHASRQPNVITVFGGLTQDPLIEYIEPRGQDTEPTPVVNFHVAERNPKNEPQFHKVVLIGPKAERFCKTLLKGDHLSVTGELVARTRKSCACCREPKHKVVSWEIWATSAVWSGLEPKR
jgi:single-stranded DNA-binding protein